MIPAVPRSNAGQTTTGAKDWTLLLISLAGEASGDFRVEALQIAPEDHALADAIRARLQKDRYLSYMVKPLGVSLGRLIACCKRHGIRYPNRHANHDEILAAIQAVTVYGLSTREAARSVGISNSAVHRYVLAHRRAYVSRGLDFHPLRVHPYRCPRHGLVSISPCIACEAMERQGTLRRA